MFVAVQGSVAVTGTDMLAEAGYSCLREAKRPSLAYVDTFGGNREQSINPCATFPKVLTLAVPTKIPQTA